MSVPWKLTLRTVDLLVYCVVINIVLMNGLLVKPSPCTTYLIVDFSQREIMGHARKGRLLFYIGIHQEASVWVPSDTTEAGCSIYFPGELVHFVKSFGYSGAVCRYTLVGVRWHLLNSNSISCIVFFCQTWQAVELLWTFLLNQLLFCHTAKLLV